MRTPTPRRLVLIATIAAVIAFACLLAGYRLLIAWQVRSIRVLGWEGDRYLWMAGMRGTIRWDVDQQIAVDRSFTPDGIRQFLVSSEGQVWGWGDDLALFQSGKWTDMKECAGLPHGRVYDMVQTGDGTIWVATWSGFKTWNRATRRWDSSPVALPGRVLVQSPDDSLWFGLAEDGVIRLQSSEQAHWTVADGLTDNRIWSLLAASDGSVWVGTGAGVSHWNGDAWKGWPDLGYPDPDGLVVYELYETRDGTIWAATSEGVARWNGKEWMTYHSVFWSTVHAFVEADDGTFWVGCNSGLFRWTGDGWYEYTAAEGLTDNAGSRLVEGTNGILYVKTGGGIYQYVAQQDHWQRLPIK